MESETEEAWSWTNVKHGWFVKMNILLCCLKKTKLLGCLERTVTYVGYTLRYTVLSSSFLNMLPCIYFLCGSVFYWRLYNRDNKKAE